MEHFQAFAQPWWVNLLIVIPATAYFQRRKGLQLAWRRVLIVSIFAAAFGFVEASVVVYLRAAFGLLPGYNTATLAGLRRLSVDYQQVQSMAQFPRSLLSIEVLREAATMAMLVSVGWLAGSNTRERWAFFLWAFAVWDIAYYGGLWATLGWPRSLVEPDVLFLIPVPWLAQVWYPLLVSALTLLAVILTKRKPVRLLAEDAAHD
jgi:hypothetical protein